MKIAFKGDRLFQAALHDAKTGLREHVEDAVAETAFAIEAGVKMRIQRGEKTGRIYQKYKPKRTHQASAPGQSPATDTGGLVASIYTDLQGLSATVGSRIARSADLEYGTTRIRPRPAWEPELEKQKPLFPKRIREAIRAAFR